VVPAKRADRCTGGAPPILGILFAPERVRVRDRERRARLPDDRPCRIEQDRFDARGAEIDAKLHGVQTPADPHAGPGIQRIPRPTSA
jgi:hypothetical protein